MEKVMSRDGCVKRWRRRMTAALLAFAVFPMIASASVQDKVARFSTPGPDCYADGTLVADGECYALVWSPKGATFAGFNADGTAISAADRVILAAPLALDGKCQDSLFQIPADEYAELEGGEWAVCLVDTRMANGVPAGVKDNAPLRVNRWGAVRNEVKISTASTLALDGIAAPKAGGRSLLAAAAPTSEAGVCAGTLSAVPDSVKPPTITGLDVLDSGEVWLEVADTVPFLSYTIISGSEPGNLQEDGCAEVVDGTSGGKILIGTAQSSDCRFFKVKRAE